MSIVATASQPIVHVRGLDDHALLEDYRSLSERNLASERGAFIAESERVLAVLLERSRFEVRSVLVAASRLEKVAPLLNRPLRTWPVFVAEQPVLDGIVGFHIHRGVLAAGVRTNVPAPAELLARVSAPRLVVVLEGLTNHDNVGGVFRNAAAFGADAVLYDSTTCDPLYRKAIRVSAGASLFVPFARAGNTIESLSALRERGFTILAFSPRADADMTDLGRHIAMPARDEPLGEEPRNRDEPLGEEPRNRDEPLGEEPRNRDEPLGEEPRNRVALLLGSEGPGLSDQSMRAADHVVRIDMASGFDSLNVATASGIAMHAIRSLTRPKPR